MCVTLRRLFQGMVRWVMLNSTTGSKMYAAETAISIVSTSTTRGIKPDHVGHVAKDLKRKEGRRARSEVRVKCKQHTAEQHSGEAP